MQEYQRARWIVLTAVALAVATTLSVSKWNKKVRSCEESRQTLHIHQEEMFIQNELELVTDPQTGEQVLVARPIAPHGEGHRHGCRRR